MSLLNFRPGLLVLPALLLAVPARAGTLVPNTLRCERRLDPQGLGETAPRLGWILTAAPAGARDLRQSAYEILVATSPDLLVPGQADLWDSGRTESDHTQNIAYSGRALTSRLQCWWKVGTWDRAGAVEWSPPARWSMGLLAAGDWQAAWIGHDTPAPDDGSTVSADQYERLASYSWMRSPQAASRTQPLSLWVRRVFQVPSEFHLARALFTVVPDQVATVTVNGQLAGTATRWERARPLDVTALIRPGPNALGLKIVQEDGYPPAALGELELTFADAAPVRLAVDGSWQSSAEAPPAGWDLAAYDDHVWQSLELISGKATPWGSPQNATKYLPPAPFLRREFTVTKPVRRATVYATALGLYELHLNGGRVGADFLTPGWTDYGHRVDYQTYDVTAAVRPGTNAIGAILGDGWFAGTAAYTGRRSIYGGYPRLRAQLEIDYQDGTRDIVATDARWRAWAGPIRYDDLYQGYAYDGRLAAPGWSKPGFDDSAWTPAEAGLRAIPGSAAPLRTNFVVQAATIEPVRASAFLPARAVTSPAPGVYVADLGQNMVGWARLRVRGPRGRQVTVRHGEMLNPNGTVYTSNLRGAAATDIYWLAGDGLETLEPRFTFHGFRYVEVTGLDAAPALADITGVVVQSQLERTGDFSCSNPEVNRLFQNIIWGQRGNYLEVPTDCPQRDERLGWTGDTQFFARTGSYNFDVDNFLERWLVTIATDEQGDDGTFPDVAPTVGNTPHAVTAWGDAALVCTYTLWKVYDDTRVVDRHFDQLARYVGWLQAHANHNIIRVGGYGDWLNKGGGAKTEVMDTAYYAYLCGLMADMARATHRTASADYYADLQRQVTASFRTAFVQSDGSILDSSQTGYALAFTMGLLPGELKARAADKFVGEIASRNWHLATGFIGTPRLLPALHAAGRDDVAYRLLLQDTYPSWLFQVRQGATTMWERWDGWTPDNGFQTIDMNSFNHYAFGSVGEYLYRFVAGIDTDGPGFRRITIAPEPRAGLTQARASFESPSGPIASAWETSAGRVRLDVTIPANASAAVRVPTSDPGSVTEGGRPATGGTAQPGAVLFQIGSGTYRFEAALPSP